MPPTDRDYPRTRNYVVQELELIGLIQEEWYRANHVQLSPEAAATMAQSIRVRRLTESIDAASDTIAQKMFYPPED